MTETPRRPAPGPRRKAPATLSRPAANWWRATAAEFGIDDPAGLMLLSQAAAAWDQVEAASQLLKAEGLVVPGPRGPRPHPATGALRDARAALLSAMRALRLDVIPPTGVNGRPPRVEG